MIQPTYDNDPYDYGGATSAMMGYANRSNSASNLVARTSSPMLSGEGPASSHSMSRSRSRVNFSALESFEEGSDYLTLGEAAPLDSLRFTSTSRTPSPVTSLVSKRISVSNIPSPKGSPRSSVEDGRKEDTSI